MPKFAIGAMRLQTNGPLLRNDIRSSELGLRGTLPLQRYFCLKTQPLGSPVRCLRWMAGWGHCRRSS